MPPRIAFQTRSGKEFSPYDPYPIAPIVCASTVDVVSLLRDAVTAECDNQDEDGCPMPMPAPGAAASEDLTPTLGSKRQRSASPPELGHRLSWSHRRRRHRRQLAKQASRDPMKLKVIEAYVKPSIPVTTNLETTGLPSTSCGYSAKSLRNTQDGTSGRALAELIAEGFEVVAWDGL